jgi:hypothetical protein
LAFVQIKEDRDFQTAQAEFNDKGYQKRSMMKPPQLTTVSSVAI